MSTVAVSKVKNLRVSPQKARLVVDQIRGLPVEMAVNILAFSDKKAAVMIKKIIESAVANAENNHSIDIDELKINEIYVDQGIVMKRIMPRAKGRADRITKRSCHITVKLSAK